jgi:monofunctional biosynthetic peptidoglycan transglycosylase
VRARRLTLATLPDVDVMDNTDTTLVVARGMSRMARALRVAVVLLAVGFAAAVALLWPALAADVGRLATRWPATLPHDRRPPAWTPLSAIDPKLRWAVVTAEDARFFVHDGIDWEATFDALRTNLERGRYARGGSTITQQLAKNLFLSREKSLLRKVREAALAWRLEATLPKRRILELYLNVAEWGPGVYGAEQAARHYLGHPAAYLTWGEAATLAAVLPSPVNKLNPDRAPGRVRRRRAVILEHLYQADRISSGELIAARSAPLTAAEARAAAAAEARAEREAAEARAGAEREAAEARAGAEAQGPATTEPGAGEAGEAARGHTVLEMVAPPSGPEMAPEALLPPTPSAP